MSYVDMSNIPDPQEQIAALDRLWAERNPDQMQWPEHHELNQYDTQVRDQFDLGGCGWTAGGAR